MVYCVDKKLVERWGYPSSLDRMASIIRKTFETYDGSYSLFVPASSLGDANKTTGYGQGKAD